MARAAARHILVETKDKCEQIKNEIQGGADFAEMAKKYSTCPSSKEGGSLGSFRKGVMVPEFDDVVFSAPLGEVQGPVETQFGFHLIEVTMRS